MEVRGPRTIQAALTGGDLTQLTSLKLPQNCHRVPIKRSTIKDSKGLAQRQGLLRSVHVRDNEN